MARQKLSEYRAKQLLSQALGVSYGGLSIDTGQPGWEAELGQLAEGGRYVVKVDQGVKRRGQQGLLYVDRSAAQVPDDIRALAAKRFRFFLIEPLVAHAPEAERYLA
ncbi:MAG TPA: hypothetical protein VMR75_03115, partial [Candidatus Saccharimonadales bacterium]|nr:hypothetical protein [Candidatus Saccharimonadales bacterium]